MPLTMKTLETSRLILRSWRLSDAPDMFEYASMPTVGPNAGWKPHQSLSDSEKIIRMFLSDDDVWAVVLKASGKVIGSVGLHDRQKLDGEIVKELGYVLSTSYEGQGLMTEACLEAIRYAFEDLKIGLLKADHFLPNDKSRRVIEKCGFVYEGEIALTTADGRKEPAKIYHMTPNDYQKTRRKPS
jgi:ribosomal-protein-alanine N-acetyltransferase